MYGNAESNRFGNSIKVVCKGELLELVKESQIVTGKKSRDFTVEGKSIQIGWDGLNLDCAICCQTNVLGDQDIANLVKRGLFTQAI